MLIHAPQPWDEFRGGDYAEGNREVWRALEEAHRAGTVRTIGMSNFLRSDLEDLLEHAEVVPHVNQLLVHAGNTPRELLDFCEAKGIRVQAYSPIAHGAILENPEVNAMAYDHGYFYPGPSVEGATLDLAPEESQQVIEEFGRDWYDDLIESMPTTTPLPPDAMVLAFDIWDREIGAGKYEG